MADAKPEAKAEAKPDAKPEAKPDAKPTPVRAAGAAKRTKKVVEAERIGCRDAARRKRRNGGCYRKGYNINTSVLWAELSTDSGRSSLIPRHDCFIAQTNALR